MSPHQTSYWRLVCDCLLTFHKFTEEEALHAIHEFRVKLSNLRDREALDLIYHQEPYYLAAQLAGAETREPPQEEAVRYGEMLERRTNEIAALGTDEEVRNSAKRGKAA